MTLENVIMRLRDTYKEKEGIIMTILRKQWIKSAAVLSAVAALTIDPLLKVQGQTYYTVQPNDTIYGIAQRYGLSPDTLMRMNNLSSSLIDVGDLLMIEGAGSTQPSSSTPSSSPSQSGATYVVQPGDTLYNIARAYGLSLDQLKAMNGLSSNYIFAGDQLAVASGGTTSVGQSSTGQVGQGSSTSQGNYTISPGDTLSGIAQYYGVSVEQLKAWNGLVSDLIYPGYRLSIYGNSTSQGQSVTPSYSSNSASPSYGQASGNAYTIKAGDNLYDLGLAYGLSMETLMAYNGLSSNMIYPGQVIYIPSGSTSQSGNNQSSSTQVPSASSGDSSSSQDASSSRGQTPNAAGSHKDQEKEVTIRRPKTKESDELTDPNTLALDPAQINLSKHVVVEGDDLKKIADQYQISEKELRQWNNLLNDELQTGQELYVSDPSQVVTSFGQERPLKSVYPLKYTLKVTDKLSDVETLFGVSESQIRQWSQLEDNSEVKVGDELTVTQPDQKPEIHQVKKEDSLASISQEYGVSVEALRFWNGLLDNVVYVDEEIAVGNPWVDYHEVQPGETLESIAASYNVSVEDLRKWNKLPETAAVVSGILKVSDPKYFDESQENPLNQTETTEVSEETASDSTEESSTSEASN